MLFSPFYFRGNPYSTYYVVAVMVDGRDSKDM